jgi:hypothetical protein
LVPNGKRRAQGAERKAAVRLRRDRLRRRRSTALRFVPCALSGSEATLRVQEITTPACDLCDEAAIWEASFRFASRNVPIVNLCPRCTALQLALHMDERVREGLPLLRPEGRRG